MKTKSMPISFCDLQRENTYLYPFKGIPSYLETWRHETFLKYIVFLFVIERCAVLYEGQVGFRFKVEKYR